MVMYLYRTILLVMVLTYRKAEIQYVWYGLTFSWELFEQANSRLHRQGQRKNVFVHYLLGSNTIDHLVLKCFTQ